MKSVENNWEIWNDEKEYGDVFFKRATSDFPEMESSKAVAKIAEKLVKKNDLVLDVGCGAGHYLRSLLNKLTTDFHYHGIDATSYYIDLAKKAWNVHKAPTLLSASFEHGDIFNLSLKDAQADLVMCNNVLLHLPSIEKPIQELVRVSKRHIVLRTLIGSSSFRIKQISEPEVFDEFGEPINYFYYNIYSQAYIKSVIEKQPKVKSVQFFEDVDFDIAKIAQSASEYSKIPRDITKAVNGMQVNNYIIQPWQFVIIEKEEI